jgi:Domain of unknown function (DUF6458)
MIGRRSIDESRDFFADDESLPWRNWDIPRSSYPAWSPNYARGTRWQTPGEVMGIGAGIVLIAVGAILAFAVNFTISGIEISTIGLILMVAGVMGIVVALVMNNQRSRTGHTVVREERPGDPPFL